MKANTRTRNSIYNVSANLINQLIKNILFFGVRTIFIKVLGETYLGVNSLLTNVLSMLSIAEMGFSTAISISLYKPIAENNNNKISILMSFYKRVYRILGGIVAILGIILYFFLGYFIKDIEQIQDLSIIYFLYLINSVSSYFLAYKETLIQADQKAYKLAKFNLIFTFILSVFQILALIMFKSFIIYLLCNIIINFLQRYTINRYVTKQYDNINFKSNEKLDKISLKEITVNIKALFLHKIGDFCIYGTDSIVISTFIGINVVGYYTNYQTIINLVQTIITLIFTGVSASMGNIIVKESKEKQLEITSKLDFIAYCIYSTCVVELLFLINPFISVWIGEKYILPNVTVILIIISFYLTLIRIPISTVKTAAGLNDQDKYIPIIQASINLVLSVILAQLIGIDGIIIGTIISSILPCLYRPYIVYKYALNKSVVKYYKKHIKNIICIFISCIINYLIVSNLKINNDILEIILKGGIILIAHIVILISIYRKTDEFKYITDMMNNIIKNIGRRIVVLYHK